MHFPHKNLSSNKIIFPIRFIFFVEIFWIRKKKEIFVLFFSKILNSMENIDTVNIF